MVEGFLVVQNLPNDSQIFFALRFFNEYFPNCNSILNDLYKSTIPFLSYISMVYPCLAIYASQHGKFCLAIFKTYVAKIAEFESEDSDDFIDQEEVRKRIVFCIETFSKFLRAFTLSLDEMKNLIVVFAFSVCILGIAAVIWSTSGYVTSEHYPRILVFSIVSTWGFCGAIWSGQSLESEMEELPNTLIKVNWYNFDKHNKKLYLIFLMNLMQDRKLKFSENYSMNYQLGLAIVQGIYALASFVVKMKN